jgi:transposase
MGMLAKPTRTAILRLSAEGHGSRRIASILSVARNSVRRVVQTATDEPPQLNRPSTADPHRNAIAQFLLDLGGNISEARRALCERGVQLPYSTLSAFCRRNDLVKVNSNPVLSVNAAQHWLSYFPRDVKEIDRLQAKLGADLAALLSYLKHGRARHRKKAATIVARTRGIPNSVTARALHSSVATTRHYFKLYTELGVRELFAWNTTRAAPSTAEDRVKTNRILELLHNKPVFYGINRTNWTQPTLFDAYSRSFGETIARTALTRLLRQAGYRWRKARRVLTSPDPCYHEKVELLMTTLHSLTSDEMFFFLDEWGPAQVKKRGGRAYRRHHPATEIPRHQTPKGTVSLVSALCATTNRVTWHFVDTKDSVAMSDLLEILFNQYHSMRRIYVTWDAVAWHNSASLLDALDHFNEITLQSSNGPILELVPLPTSAQFINVIEGVLSGMTRAVVDNSDYSSTTEMKQAISRHFVERNEHFQNNPRRVGKKIWDLDFFHDVETLRAGDYREW